MRHECGLPQFDQQLDIQDRWVILRWCLDDVSVFRKTSLMFQFGWCFSFPENIHRNGVGRVIEEETPSWPEGERRLLNIENLLNSGTIERGWENVIENMVDVLLQGIPWDHTRICRSRGVPKSWACWPHHWTVSQVLRWNSLDVSVFVKVNLKNYKYWDGNAV